jgi:hypothetical protein
MSRSPGIRGIMGTGSHSAPPATIRRLKVVQEGKPSVANTATVYGLSTTMTRFALRLQATSSQTLISLPQICHSSTDTALAIHHKLTVAVEICGELHPYDIL